MALRRFRRDGDGESPAAERGGVTTRDRVDDAPVRDRNGDAVATDRPLRRDVDDDRARPLARDRDATLRSRDEFAGTNLGAAFFGWLVAVGMAAILTAIVAAAGTAVGLTNGSPNAGDAGTIGIVGGALLVAILALAYYCGGYVAGRMSRFDGGRQGFATWLIGLLVTVLIGAAGALFGSQYNVLEKLNLPRIPIDEGSLATGGAIALAAVLLGTLLAAILGGKVGQRYHRRVDSAVLADH
jgi:hypothetical protein